MKMIDEVAGLYVDGMTVRQIAEKVGMGSTAVWRRLELAGIERRATGRRPEANDDKARLAALLRRRGKTYEEIARSMGYASKGMAHRLVQRGMANG